MRVFINNFLLISILFILTSCNIKNKQEIPIEHTVVHLEESKAKKTISEDTVDKSEGIIDIHNETTIEDLYAPIINAYKELEQSNFKHFNENILGDSILAIDEGDTYHFNEGVFPVLKYAFYDINSDGSTELIIGANDLIAGIYALQNDKPTYILQAEIKLGIDLFVDIDGNTVIDFSWGHMGYAMESYRTIDTKGNLITLDTLYTNGSKIINDEFVGYFRTKIVNDEEINITEEEYFDIIQKYGSWGYYPIQETEVRTVDIKWELIADYNRNKNVFNK